MSSVPALEIRRLSRLLPSLLLLAAPVAAESERVQLANPVVMHPVRFGETGMLRDSAIRFGPMADEIYRRREKDEEENEEIRELNTVDTGAAFDPNAPEQFDGAKQTAFGPGGVRIPTPILTFEGLSAADNTLFFGTTVAPSDQNGAVGPSHFVETTNTLVRVWDKSGNPIGTPFKMSAVFAALGGICAVNNQGDPVVLYDRIADRWMLSQFAFASQTAPPFHECVAVSKTGDPTGAYWVYDFITPGSNFPDYPKLGAWSDGYYMSTRQFLMPAQTFNSFGIFAFDRAKMMVGDPTAAMIYFNLGAVPFLSNASSGIIPSDFQGLTPPPAGAPNPFAIYTDDAFTGDAADRVRLFDFHADFATPASSTFTERSESPIAVASFDSRSPSGRADIEQPAPATAADSIDSIGDRLMFRMQYLNRAGTESLVLVHTVNAGTIPAPGVAPTQLEYRAAQRYYELRKTTPGGSWTVNGQATFSPDATERSMGSTAMDSAGNIAVAYTISSGGVFPSLAYAGRLFSDPPNGLFQGEATMYAGTGAQRGTSNRWGDYSSLTLDPSDDATFWYVNQYYATSPSTGFDWHTRIGAFKFAGTTAPAQGTLAGTVTACDSGVPLADSVATAVGGPSDGYSSTTGLAGAYSKNLAPGNYDVTISNPAHSCQPAGPFADVINAGATTIQDACLTGVPKFAVSNATISGGNGDATLDADECADLTLDLTNIGCLIAPGVTATLSSPTPGVTITQPNTTFATMNENATAQPQVDFSVSTSAAFVCGTTIQFSLAVNSPSGGSISLPFSLPSCVLPPTVINGALTAGDSLQQLRLGRNGIASACPTLKANPGTLGAGGHHYDIYNFVNGPQPACVKVDLTPSCSSATNPIISVAYLNSFDPNNIGTNYLGDPGGSPATGATVSFSVPVAADATLLVNVHEILDTQPLCSGYTLTIGGIVGDTTGNGPCTPCSLGAVSNITASNDAGQCGALVGFTPPQATGTCGVVTCDHQSGAFFPVGLTTVSCSSTAGPTSSFNVTVNDTEPPTVTAPTLTVPTDPGLCTAVVGFSSTVGDNCPIDAAPNCVQPSGSAFPLGANPVTCSVTDASGNPNSANGSITVEDHELPVITCPADVELELPPGETTTGVNFPPPGVTDNCPSSSAECAPPSGSDFPIGDTVDTCVATDGSGNTAECSFAIHIDGLSVLEIPALSRGGLAALALALGALALTLLLRRRS